MAEKLLFTVVIPTLNEERSIPLLLRDILAQSYLSVEIVVIDCKSTDNTKKEVLAVGRRSPIKITFISSDKKGPAYQRNLGAQHAQGQFLIFLDADSRLPGYFFTILEQQIQKHPGFLYTTYLASFDPHATQDILLLDTTNVLLEVVNLSLIHISEPTRPY